MTKVAAVEYGDKGIRVNSVHPGATVTGRIKNVHNNDVLEALAKTIPIRRFAQPREISYAVLFLASDEASYITGSELVVDGGRLAE